MNLLECAFAVIGIGVEFGCWDNEKVAPLLRQFASISYVFLRKGLG